MMMIEVKTDERIGGVRETGGKREWSGGRERSLKLVMAGWLAG